jgi:predicted DNA-binding transcriptional regulator YafY
MEDLNRILHVTILYTNHKGVTAKRNILPTRMWFGKTEWHPTQQWLLAAYDLDKEAHRDFAIKDILAWEEKTEQSNDSNSNDSNTP